MRGEIVITGAIIIEQTATCALIHVNMSTKRAELSYTSDQNGHPVLGLCAVENSVYLDKDKLGIDTGIAFYDFKGWSFFAVQVSKYDCHVVLWKH